MGVMIAIARPNSSSTISCSTCATLRCVSSAVCFSCNAEAKPGSTASALVKSGMASSNSAIRTFACAARRKPFPKVGSTSDAFRPSSRASANFSIFMYVIARLL